MSAELHQKILGFLAGEFAKRDEQVCVNVELMYSPGNGYKDEQVREWIRANDPDRFELANIPDFVSNILDIAEGEADAKASGRHRFFIRTTQFLRGRQICSFALQPSYTGSDDSSSALATAAAGGGGRQDSAAAMQIMSNHSSQLMRVNVQMFDGALRSLSTTNERLSKANADLQAENVLLRREVEDARSTKDERDFQIAMAAQKNARSNAGWAKLLQLSTVVVAKIGASAGALPGGDAAGGGPSSFQILVSEFGSSLRPEQIQVLVTTLDMPQKIMFKEIMDIAQAAQQAAAQAAASTGAPQPPNGAG